MDYFLNQIAQIHEYIWPLAVVGLLLIDRRLRKVEQLEYSMHEQLDLLIRSHHLENGDSDAHVRLYPD